MRYCIIGPAHPYRGGIAHHTTLLHQRLGVSHDVSTVSFRRLYPSMLFPGKSQTDAGKPGDGIPAERLIDSMNPLTWAQAGRRVSSLRPDYVLVQWWQAFFGPCLSSVIARTRPAKTIFICHNVLPHESNPLFKRLAMMALRKGDGFIVHAREEQDLLADLLPGRPVVRTPLPAFEVFPRKGISKEDARAQLKVAGRVVLFFGLVRKYKGLMDLISAMDLLKGKGITCLVVGEFYDGKDQYLGEIERRGLGDSIRVIDRYVPNDEVEPYFAAADVVVLPYVSATQSAIVQVAYHFEKPVVATKVGGLPEAVDDGRTGLLVPPRDPDALAGAILRYFDGNMEPALADGVRSAKERFSWDRTIEALESLGAMI